MVNKAEYAEYLKGDHWQETRKMMLAFTRNRCQLCSSNGTTHDVHHNNYDRLGSEWVTDLVVLCRPCHERHHGIQEAVQVDQSLTTECEAWACILGCLLALRRPGEAEDGWFLVEHEGGLGLIRSPLTFSRDHEILKAMWNYAGKHRTVPGDDYLRAYFEGSGEEDEYMNRVRELQAIAERKRHRHSYLGAALTFVTLCGFARHGWAREQREINEMNPANNAKLKQLSGKVLA